MIASLKRNRFSGMIGIFLVFLGMAGFLFLERTGVLVRETAYVDPYLSIEDSMTPKTALAQEPVTSLLITDLGREDCYDAYEQFCQILLDMKVNFDLVDLGSTPCPRDFSAYTTVVVLTPDIEALGDSTISLMDWAYEGGRVFFAMCLESGSYSTYALQCSGVTLTGDYTTVDRIWFDQNFILGGGTSYEISDAFDSAIEVSLREDVDIYARLENEDGIPLIWKNSYGIGCIVVTNFGIYEKSVRGLYSSAYTLLEDVAVYPVLNCGVVFLDDMPSPVPEGDSEYITRDFNCSISTFYTNYWFPDIQKLSEKYGFPLVGLVIENYENNTSGVTTAQSDTTRFSYFGNLILRSGGELGYHGYNHQPLCLDDVDYGDKFDYNTWNSIDAISNSFSELKRFCENLFPQAKMSVYVPPSNILSEEGRAYLGALYPAIRTISGTYFEEVGDDFTYVHEFSVSEDGIVELPRITSGSLIESFTTLAALSELNFHMAFSHFIHPDDALDPDRGAELGWKQQYTNMDNFFQWVLDTDPSMNFVDSATFSGKIQRWAKLTVEKQWSGNALYIHLGNFVDEASLQIRFNNGVPTSIEGGTLIKLTDTLYLLEANQAEIIMEWS